MSIFRRLSSYPPSPRRYEREREQPDKFKDDNAALAHVRKLADGGSPLHKLALEIHEESDE